MKSAARLVCILHERAGETSAYHSYGTRIPLTRACDLRLPFLESAAAVIVVLMPVSVEVNLPPIVLFPEDLVW